MMRTIKNLEIVCVKLFGKFGRMLVADLAYVTVHHVKSIYRTLRTSIKKCEKCQFPEYLTKTLISLLNQQKTIYDSLFLVGLHSPKNINKYPSEMKK